MKLKMDLPMNGEIHFSINFLSLHLWQNSNPSINMSIITEMIFSIAYSANSSLLNIHPLN